MRTYGRVTDEYGKKTWVVVETDAEGYNDYVYITALIQTLKLNLGESPFYAKFGIPARSAVQTQVEPNAQVNFISTYYSRFFASLIIAKKADDADPTPVYNISIVRKNGSKFNAEVPV